MVRFQCPKCGGMYLKDGRCETCGFVVSEKKAETTNQKNPAVSQANMGNLQPCPNCGKLVSRDAVSCPQCRYRLPQRVSKKSLMQCPDCGSMISLEATSCPECGCPFPGNMPQMMQKTQGAPVKKSSGLGLFGATVAIVLAGLILWYLIAPFSTPLWLQHIGGSIKAMLTGEQSYTVFDPSKLAK